MGKPSVVKAGFAIDFNIRNMCDKIDRAKSAISNAAASPAPTASFSWAKDDYAATHPDKETYRVTPYIADTSYSCLFGSAESKGVKTEAYSEMLTFSGGHEVSPSRAFFGVVTVVPLGNYTVVPKFVVTGGQTYPGVPFTVPPSADCAASIGLNATAITGDWDYGPPSFGYNEVENKVLCSHDCWQTVLVSGSTAWDSVEYTYPAQRLIKSSATGGYPFKNDVLQAAATEIAYSQDPTTGVWVPYNRYRNGTTTAPLLPLGERTEVYRVISNYVVDGKDKWELPPGWPADMSYPIQPVGPRKFPKSIVTQQPWEIGYLMLDGTLKIDMMSAQIFKPYKGIQGYTPKFVYVEAKLTGDALDIRDTLLGGTQSIRDRLAVKYPNIDLVSRA